MVVVVIIIVAPRPGHGASAALGAESGQGLVLQGGGGVREVLPRSIFRRCCGVWVCGSFDEEEVDGAEGGEAGGDDAKVDFRAGPDHDGGYSPADVRGAAVEFGADD